MIFLFQLLRFLLDKGKQGLQTGKAMSFTIGWVFEHGAPFGRVVGFQPQSQQVGAIGGRVHVLFVTNERQKSVKICIIK